MTTDIIVTKDSLQGMIDGANRTKQIAIIGRALVVLFLLQTRSEQSQNDTNEHNMVGFTGADGRGGCLTAKSFLKNKTLQDWQLEKWTRKNDKGYSRISKYHAQLNRAAVERAKMRKAFADDMTNFKPANTMIAA